MTSFSFSADELKLTGVPVGAYCEWGKSPAWRHDWEILAEWLGGKDDSAITQAVKRLEEKYEERPEVGDNLRSGS